MQSPAWQRSRNPSRFKKGKQNKSLRESPRGSQRARRGILMPRGKNCRETTLRAKGTLISEPRFSTPCEMRFFPREKGKTAILKEKPSKKAIFPFSREKNRISQGVENRGSLISAPLAARHFLPLNCRAITLTTGAILKEEEMSSTVGERQFGRHFKRQFGRGYLRVKNCRETVGSQFLPRGIKMSRRALWVPADP